VNKRLFFVILMSMAVSLQGIMPAFASNQKLIAVRKAYFSATGKKWDDASSTDKKRFLKRFADLEKRQLLQEKLDVMRQDQNEIREQRKRQREYTLLERKKALRERKKMIEEREWLRQKELRKREMERAKEKLIQARQNFESRKSR